MLKTAICAILAITLRCVSGSDSANGVDCTHDAIPCDFSMGGGQCCWTISSIPQVVPHNDDDEYGRPMWIPNTTQTYCGLVYAPYLGYPCATPTATYCGDPALADCF